MGESLSQMEANPTISLTCVAQQSAITIVALYISTDAKYVHWTLWSLNPHPHPHLNAGQGGSVTGRGLRLAKSGVVLCIDNW